MASNLRITGSPLPSGERRSDGDLPPSRRRCNLRESPVDVPSAAILSAFRAHSNAYFLLPSGRGMRTRPVIKGSPSNPPTEEQRRALERTNLKCRQTLEHAETSKRQELEYAEALGRIGQSHPLSSNNSERYIETIHAACARSYLKTLYKETIDRVFIPATLPLNDAIDVYSNAIALDIFTYQCEMTQYFEKYFSESGGGAAYVDDLAFQEKLKRYFDPWNNLKIRREIIGYVSQRIEEKIRSFVEEREIIDFLSAQCRNSTESIDRNILELSASLRGQIICRVSREFGHQMRNRFLLSCIAAISSDAEKMVGQLLFRQSSVAAHDSMNFFREGVATVSSWVEENTRSNRELLQSLALPMVVLPKESEEVLKERREIDLAALEQGILHSLNTHASSLIRILVVELFPRLLRESEKILNKDTAPDPTMAVAEQNSAEHYFSIALSIKEKPEYADFFNALSRNSILERNFASQVVELVKKTLVFKGFNREITEVEIDSFKTRFQNLCLPSRR